MGKSTVFRLLLCTTAILCSHLVLASAVLADGNAAVERQGKPVPDTTAPANSVWENFKRISRGETSLDESIEVVEETTQAPQVESHAAEAQTIEVQTVETATVEPQAAEIQTVENGKPETPATPSLSTAGAKSNQALIKAPLQATEDGGWWQYFAGTMEIADNDYYDTHGIDYKWAYARKEPLPENPRIFVDMHGSGGGEGHMRVFGPSPRYDIEVRTQDAEPYNSAWREWWTFGSDGINYPGRRIVAALQFLVDRYHIDVTGKGFVLQGVSMGGTGAVIQTMILPAPWRQYIAYSSALSGVIMPRQIARRDPAQYATLPPDNAQYKALWDSIDFTIQSTTDPIVRGMHYRHAFSSSDQFSAGVDLGSTQLLFINLVEQQKIGGAFGWVQEGHSYYENGVNLPDMSRFESPDQDVTLDRAHPAITNSTGNYPLLAADRINQAKFPRGHYNMGIIWDHANIIDDASQIVFPLKYQRHVGIGKGVPDQPAKITLSVTPRRARNFQLHDGETLKWSWDGGALSGVATVTGDTVTVDDIPLVSGDGYKTLRIYR